MADADSKKDLGFDVRLADGAADIHAAQRLRYDVFVRELGGTGEMVNHVTGREEDLFDPVADHLLLIDKGTEAVVGVYRVMDAEMARRAGGFYSASEYDLTPLTASGRRVLELGRSCLHPDYRGGGGMHALWSGLAHYAKTRGTEIMFGVASFAGQDIAPLAQSLALLHHRHLAPAHLRVRARGIPFQTMDLIPEAAIDRKTAMVAMPSLIKAYLRLGGVVGEGAFIDRTFNTVDVCMILDMATINPRQARIYGGDNR